LLQQKHNNINNENLGWVGLGWLPVCFSNAINIASHSVCSGCHDIFAELWLHACGIGAMIGQITSMCPAAILVVTVQMACLVAVWLMTLLAAWLLALLMWWKLGQC